MFIQELIRVMEMEIVYTLEVKQSSILFKFNFQIHVPVVVNAIMFAMKEPRIASLQMELLLLMMYFFSCSISVHSICRFSAMEKNIVMVRDMLLALEIHVLAMKIHVKLGILKSSSMFVTFQM